MAKRGGLGKALLAGVGLVAGAFVMRGAIQRAARAKAYLAEGIDEKIWIEIGGIPQWVTIRGRDLDSPLLLVLHGGPGSALSVLAGKLFPGWDAHFIVVNWDQRGAGRTLGRNGKAGCGTLTIGRMVVDGIELAQELRRRFPGRPLVLLGVSWGSLLGVEMARARPDLFSAYVGAGQVVDMNRGEQLSYFGTVDRLRAKGEERAAQGLEAIGPPPYPSIKALAKQRKLLISTMPKAERNVFRRLPLDLLLAPDARLRDLVEMQRGAKFSINELWKQLMAWRLADVGYDLGVPVTIIQGELDLQTPTALVTEAAVKLKADLVILEGAGHMALVTHGDQFLKALVKRARPGAKGRKTAKA
ncbi:MAG TPA: alpha/beta hydrolase [Phenylobacterium sp.]|uniref:alpha/beta fold hydrolase n=1 Tax=Phenylobacterium sp. TaxID=1871053 RepID=UPI002BF15B32|nr:alpha/beta hydrolase [Phenylobacterium sp.]HSV02558.1 alpha/beta hydrolase [Phenylobacterium sp.]